MLAPPRAQSRRSAVHPRRSARAFTPLRACTPRYIFDLQDGDTFFCTADCGWITGHSYVAYGPLLNGASQLVFEGVPSYPDAGRLWRIVDKYKVRKARHASLVVVLVVLVVLIFILALLGPHAPPDILLPSLAGHPALHGPHRYPLADGRG